MIFNPPLREAKLVKRYKRFLADVIFYGDDAGQITTVHCPNTGSMKNCQSKNARVWCSISENKKRKYPYTWELICLSSEHQDKHSSAIHHIGINTHKANPLVEEAILKGVVSELQGYEKINREVKYGNGSRIDFLLQSKNKSNCYVEVKSVTLSEESGVGLFPDAVTARGTRHLKDLIAMRQSGARAVLFFCVQHTGIEVVRPAGKIDYVYEKTLKEAYLQGVEIIAYKAFISPSKIFLATPLPVELT